MLNWARYVARSKGWENFRDRTEMFQVVSVWKSKIRMLRANRNCKVTSFKCNTNKHFCSNSEHFPFLPTDRKLTIVILRLDLIWSCCYPDIYATVTIISVHRVEDSGGVGGRGGERSVNSSLERWSTCNSPKLCPTIWIHIKSVRYVCKSMFNNFRIMFDIWRALAHKSYRTIFY